MKKLFAMCSLSVVFLAGCETHTETIGIIRHYTDETTGCEYIVKGGVTPRYELINGEYEIKGCEDKNEL